jgi:hypothetical protein
VSDEVIPAAEEAGHEVCIALEVDTLDGRVRRKAGAVEDDELELLGERSLRRPGRPPGDHASVHQHESLHEPMLSGHELIRFSLSEPKSTVTSTLICSGRMTPDAASSPHSLATASGLLLGALAAAMAVGALVGWLFGGAGIGLLVGALVGIPLGVLVVYQVYGRASST